jgi:hypothetical protein
MKETKIYQKNGFLKSSGSGTGPLSLVRIIEELLQGNSGSGLENLN